MLHCGITVRGDILPNPGFDSLDNPELLLEKETKDDHPYLEWYVFEDFVFQCIEDITQWHKDGFYLRVMKVMSVANEKKYCYHHEKIKSISSSHHVIFFLLYT